jgi:hypothetical protein
MTAMQSLLRLCCLLLLLSACTALPDILAAPAGFIASAPAIPCTALRSTIIKALLIWWHGTSCQTQPASMPDSCCASAQAIPAKLNQPPAARVKHQPQQQPARLCRHCLQWPVRGTLIGKFNGNSNKGIDIAGKAGDPVRAAASGGGLCWQGHPCLWQFAHHQTW